MNVHALKVASTYIILLLPGFMHQVISVALEGCIVSESGPIQIGAENTPGMIWCSSRLMLSSLGCWEWLLHVFFCSFPSLSVTSITPVHSYIGLFQLETNQMMKLVCGLYDLSLRVTVAALPSSILIALLVVLTSFLSLDLHFCQKIFISLIRYMLFADILLVGMQIIICMNF
jgi:hypothetical protein